MTGYSVFQRPENRGVLRNRGKYVPKIVDEHMREATRRHILQVAAREFARLGFDQANINTIADLASIGKGTIYLYFEHKRDLFLSILRMVAQDQLAAIRTAPAREGSMHQRLERLFQAFVNLAVADEDGFQRVYERVVWSQSGLQGRSHETAAGLCGGDHADARTELHARRNSVHPCRNDRVDGDFSYQILCAFCPGTGIYIPPRRSPPAP